MKFCTRLFKDDPILVSINETTTWCADILRRAYRDHLLPETPLALRGGLRLQKTLEQIDLSGELHFNITATCDRCLDPFALPTTLPLRVTFIRQSLVDPAARETLNGDDMSVWTYSGEEIDLGAVVHELAVLSIPFHFLCSETCKGLCPKCGVNQNRESCACDRKPVDPRLAVLARFKAKTH